MIALNFLSHCLVSPLAWTCISCRFCLPPISQALISSNLCLSLLIHSAPMDSLSSAFHVIIAAVPVVSLLSLSHVSSSPFVSHDPISGPLIVISCYVFTLPPPSIISHVLVLRWVCFSFLLSSISRHPCFSSFMPLLPVARGCAANLWKCCEMIRGQARGKVW